MWTAGATVKQHTILHENDLKVFYKRTLQLSDNY